jgi:hypothetical protein
MARLEISTAQSESNLVAANSRFSRLGDNPDVAGILLGSWHTYNPTIDQGATTNIAHTVTSSEWRYDGPMIDWQAIITMTAAGTAAAEVKITPPVSVVDASGRTLGAGFIHDTSSGIRYNCAVLTNTPVLFVLTYQSGLGWGFSPNLALANTDIIGIAVRYRWA